MVWVQSHPSLDWDACDQTKTHEGKILFCFDPLITFSTYNIIKYNSYQDTFFINRLKEMCILLVLRFKHHKGCDAIPQKQRTSLLVNSHAFFSQQKPNLPQSKFFCICVCLSGDVMIPLNQTSNPASPQPPSHPACEKRSGKFFFVKIVTFFMLRSSQQIMVVFFGDAFGFRNMSL